MILSAEKQIYDTANKPNEKAAKTATDYITNTGNSGIEITGNNASSKVQIGDTVKVIADSTHFAEMTDSRFKIHAGDATNPAAYFGINEAAIGGDGNGNYYVRIYEYAPSSGVSGGAIDLLNTDGSRRIRLNAMGNYGMLTIYDSDELPEATLSVNSSTGAGYLNLTRNNGNDGMAPIASLGIGTSLPFEDANIPTLKMYTAMNSSGGSFLRGVYGGGFAWLNTGVEQGYVIHGHSNNHKMTLDCDTSSGYVAFYADGAAIGAIPVGSSDRRTKTDIEAISERYKKAVSKIELKDFRYDFTNGVLANINRSLRFGVIAQDVLEALESEGIRDDETELVSTLSDDYGERYIVNYVPFLIARIAYDEDWIHNLETRLEALTT